MSKKKSLRPNFDYEAVPFRTDFSFYEQAQNEPTQEELAIIASTLAHLFTLESQNLKQSTWQQDAIIRGLRK